MNPPRPHGGRRRGTGKGEGDARGPDARMDQLRQANEALLCSALEARERAERADRALDAYAHAAHLDVLTRLPDRSYLLDRFDHAMAQARRNGGRVAILFVDLDGFKQVNDRLGHALGDQVLQWAAGVIVGAVREADTVSRHGGDEFVIILDDLADAESAAVVARKIIAALSCECPVGEHGVRISASIGISLFPDHGEDAHALIELADRAMYRAKHGGGAGTCAVHGQTLPAPDPAGATEAAAEPQFVRQRHMQEANSQLVLAALDAKDLLSACEQAQQRQVSFMGVLAHELRSPLTPIRIAVGMLGDSGDDNALQTQLKSVINEQVTRMAALVGDLLEVSRVRTGKLHLSWQSMDLREVLRRALDSARLVTDAQSQTLEAVLPDHPLPMRGDPDRLAQVFGNLLDNATKYSPTGGRIALSVATTGGHVEVTIQDDGIGISPDALPTIFDPFVQDAHAVGFSRSGLGIGLTVVRELVHAHGGTIEAHSEGPGRGSRFVVRLVVAGNG